MIRARFYVGSGPNVLASDFEARAETAAGVLAELHVPGATVYPALGYWQDETEPSMVVEVLDCVLSVESVEAIARELAERFRQDVVIWTRETIEGGTSRG